jgi:CheY-like chemotaxis protein
MDTGNPVEILLVEDNAADARLAHEVIREARVRNHLSWVRDGVEALAFLRREGAYAHAPRPDLILLDLNLPRRDGRELLADLKSETRFRRIPVVILTTSQAEEDIVKAYHLQANSYIAKPMDLGQFLKVVKAIEAFWLTVVRLPPVETERDAPSCQGSDAGPWG